MSPLKPWRGELRALIPRGFLRRDGQEAVFVSDYPRRPGAEAVTAALEKAGFTVSVRAGLAHIGGGREKYAALLAALPCPSPAPTDETLPLYALAQRLLRAGTPLKDQPLAALGRTLKYLDAGDLSGLRAWLGPKVALWQRQRLPLPAAAGHLILSAIGAKGKGEEALC